MPLCTICRAETKKETKKKTCDRCGRDMNGMMVDASFDVAII